MNWYRQSQSVIHVWLDDERDPTEPAIQRGSGARGDEIWVKTVPEAIALLQQGNVASISLDNDLGEGLEEGYKVADWIEEAAFNGEIQPIELKVHSANPSRADYMRKAFESIKRFWQRRQDSAIM